ncbi:RDD family protein [Pelagibius sp.]|uniref:RDD family protein n=1 Tax=Pelagibius sp. TaxID=1931238 RepID=UPI003B50B630
MKFRQFELIAICRDFGREPSSMSTILVTTDRKLIDNNGGRLVLFLLLVGMVFSLAIGGSGGISRHGAPPYHLEVSYHPAHIVSWLFGTAAFFLPRVTGPLQTNQERPAGIIRRYFALNIDCFVCFVLLMMPFILLALLLEGLRAPLLGLMPEALGRWLHTLMTMLFFPGTVVAWLCAYCWPAAAGRQSAGDLLMGIEQRWPKRPSLLRSIGHALLGFLTLSLFFIGLFVALVREDRRMWHDLVFDTRNVR